MKLRMTIQRVEATVEGESSFAKATLLPGQWFTYSVDRGIEGNVTIFEGEYYKRKRVRIISKMQALALCRWHGDTGVYWSVKDGNDRWHDVYVVGDVDAFLDDGSEGE